jgi:hypothetical protein
MESKQTSVQWLENELKNRYPPINSEPLFEYANKMFEHQIIEANMSARLEVSTSILKKTSICKKSEQYYNETYKSE